MQPSQRASQNIANQDNDEEPTRNTDLNIEAKKQQPLKAFQNPPDKDFNKSRPKFFQSQAKELEAISNNGHRLSFSPILVKSLQLQGSSSRDYGIHFYSEKHNMIIACRSNQTVEFYDATTLVPCKGRETLELDNVVAQISLCSETGICVFACFYGSIYAYDIAKKTLHKFPRLTEAHSLAIAFINPECFAFSAFYQLFICNLNNETSFKVGLPNIIMHLQKQKEGHLLFAGLISGSLKVYRTDKLPQFPLICSIQGHKLESMITNIEIIKMNGKECVLTAAEDNTIKLWHVLKGQMRLLRVIRTRETVSKFVYLEKYRMIAIAQKKGYVKFLSMITGRFVSKYNFDGSFVKDLCLRKDKNALGVGDYKKNMIHILQLQQSEDINMEEKGENQG